ncbi:MAG TPA: peptidoglycan-associated lipoprotein Pal [Syntrophales bacterium]|nr:peptidoglycan-associated lipoprotein Pal [Syntrophales bacterium]
MMKRNFKIIMIIGLILCFSIMFMTGCAKKSTVKEQAVSTEEKVGKTEEAPQVSKPLKEGEIKAGEAEATQEKAVSAKEEIAFKDIHFDFDKFNLKPEARDILKQLADWLTKSKNYNVLIEGNCDERGTTEYNLALGERRAKEAMKYLVELGIDVKRIKTISYGKERPLDPGHNEDAWAKNRRDHFVVTLIKGS